MSDASIALLLLRKQPRLLFRLVRWEAVRNFVAVQFQHKILKSTKVRGFPYFLTIEPGNICQLRCPLCPTGRGDTSLSKGFMSFVNFKKIVDSMESRLMFIELYNWGEPFLNRELLDMVEYATEKRIFVQMSSNLNVDLTFETAKKIVRSGLNMLIVSCSGATEETTKKYHVGGSFERAYENMKLICATREILGKKNPLVSWRMLATKYSEHEFDLAKWLAKEAGIDYLDFAPVHCDMAKEIFMRPSEQFDNVADWLPENSRLSDYDYAEKKFKKALESSCCSFLWTRMTVNWNGEVFPCCKVFGDKWTFGNVLETSVKEVWNNPKYLAARNAVKEEASEHTICSICKANEAMT